jgi:hypothetical protein
MRQAMHGAIAGITWLVISLVILQFDSASVTTVGVLVGVMFLLAAVQNIAVTTLPAASIGTIRETRCPLTIELDGNTMIDFPPARQAPTGGEERVKRSPELGRVLRIEVDLVGDAIQAEGDGLACVAAVEVIRQHRQDFLGHAVSSH